MKAIFKSKTFWLAVLQATAGAVVVFSTSYPTVGWLMVVKSGIDIIIRLYTTQPLVQLTWQQKGDKLRSIDRGSGRFIMN